jgi:hypothetical protein
MPAIYSGAGNDSRMYVLAEGSTSFRRRNAECELSVETTPTSGSRADTVSWAVTASSVCTDDGIRPYFARGLAGALAERAVAHG